MYRREFNTRVVAGSLLATALRASVSRADNPAQSIGCFNRPWANWPLDQALAPHISGFCAKDCGDVRGEVMIQFGTGKVNFAAVLRALKAAGFRGPVMVECCQVGSTAEETTANARWNREFLERTLAALG